MPAILLCQEFDDLKVPSSPPRRLSRSSIDLRDLEAQHEREKVMSQNVSESVSSIYHCFNSQMLRYSESEPINTRIKALEEQLCVKAVNNDENQSDKNLNQLYESKSSMNKIAFMNNFDHSTRDSKDNHQIKRTNSNNGKKSFKKKMLASSDSDFFSLLRYNSVKLRRMNCFSIGNGGNNQADDKAGVVRGNSTSSSNETKPQTMIYALSDSDFLIRVSDNNKSFHLNNEKKFQAIVNKSDILNYLNKSFDHNLLDNNSVEYNNLNKSAEVESKKQFDHFNVDKLKKVFEEGSQTDSNYLNESTSMIVTDKLQKKETVSLPPLVNSTSNDLNLKLNNSLSIDTVLLNIKNSNNDKNYTFKLLHDFSPKAINQEKCLTRNLKDDSSGSDIDVQPQNNHSTLSVTALSASSLDKNASSVANGQQNLLKPVNLSDNLNGQQLSIENSIRCDTMNPACIDNDVGKRKRTASNVTYNVNVIDFHSEEEPDTASGQRRSNSSTSEY